MSVIAVAVLFFWTLVKKNPHRTKQTLKLPQSEVKLSRLHLNRIFPTLLNPKTASHSREEGVKNHQKTVLRQLFTKIWMKH